MSPKTELIPEICIELQDCTLPKDCIEPKIFIKPEDCIVPKENIEPDNHIVPEIVWARELHVSENNNETKDCNEPENYIHIYKVTIELLHKMLELQQNIYTFFTHRLYSEGIIFMAYEHYLMS